MNERLIEARHRAGYSSTNAAAAALAKRTGKHCYTTLYCAERGLRTPRASMLYAIAQLYGVSVDFLIAGGCDSWQ